MNSNQDQRQLRPDAPPAGAAKKKERLAVGALFLVTVLWGVGAVFAKIALDSGLGPSLVMTVRFCFASLLTGLLFRKTIRKAYQKGQWKGGLVIGVFLFLAFYTQIVGLQYTTPSNSAFITGAYVVFVPLIWWAFSKKRPSWVTFVSCLLSFSGVAVLSVSPGEGVGIGLGDGLTLLCAVLFAAHIVATSVLAKSIHPTVLVFMQFSVAAVLSLLVFLLSDRDVSGFVHPQAYAAMAYLGILCTFVCYFLQTLAQRHVSSSKAGIILATEALFGALASVLAGYDALSARMVTGGILMFLSILLPEVWAYRGQKPTKGETP